MIEPALVVVRLLQYLGAMVLLGSSLFFVYGLPRAGAGAAAELGGRDRSWLARPRFWRLLHYSASQPRPAF